MLEGHNSVFTFIANTLSVLVFVKWWGADAGVYNKIYKRVYRPGNYVKSKWSIIISDIY